MTGQLISAVQQLLLPCTSPSHLSHEKTKCKTIVCMCWLYWKGISWVTLAHASSYTFGWQLVWKETKCSDLMSTPSYIWDKAQGKDQLQQEKRILVCQIHLWNIVSACVKLPTYLSLFHLNSKSNFLILLTTFTHS